MPSTVFFSMIVYYHNEMNKVNTDSVVVSRHWLKRTLTRKATVIF